MRRLFTILILTFITLSANAQDFSFSSFQQYPALSNPAFTGFYWGDFRVAAFYKNQWRSVGSPFSSYVAMADAPLNLRMMGTEDFVAVGLNLMRHTAGDAGYGYSVVLLNVAYYKALDSRGKMYLAIGLQAGGGSRGIDQEALTFGNQFNGIAYDPSIAHNEVVYTDRATYEDLGIGVMWYMAPSEYFKMHMGASYLHLSRPNLSFVSGIDQLQPKTSLNAEMRIGSHKILQVIPSGYYITQGEFTEITAGLGIRYTFSKYNRPHPIIRPDNSETAITFSTWHRLNDAMILALRLEMAYATLGFSYDVNVSSLKEASHLKGGYEIFMSYNFMDIFGDRKISHRKTFM